LLALQSVLEDGGALGLMVYAKYGRFGIYQVQDLMKLINKGEEDVKQQISDTRTILSSLPETNWFIRGEELAVDHRENGDIGYLASSCTHRTGHTAYRSCISGSIPVGLTLPALRLKKPGMIRPSILKIKAC
jgi:hypothetical protein